VERVPVATTPIKAPRDPIQKAVTSVTSTKATQLLGVAPLKSGLPVRAMMAETIKVWKIVLMVGIAKMERAGTPLILKLR